MSRSSLISGVVAPIVRMIAVCAVVSGCASGGAAGGTSEDARLAYGFMVPGQRVGTTFGIQPTDSIPELVPRATLPGVLLYAISQEVATGNWNNQCTRRFGGPNVYAVIFHKACDASAGPEADPRVIVGFAADGRIVGRVAWEGPNTIALLVPARRF